MLVAGLRDSDPAERRRAIHCLNRGNGVPEARDGVVDMLRDEAPDLLEALMCDDMMCVPANVQGNRVIRAEETGPVFSLQPGTCGLNMRYTSRPHNIVWKPDRQSATALNRVREILMDGKTMIEIKLLERQGIVCNNILHGRQAFQNGADMPPRLVYRARYYDAISFDKALA